MKDLAFAKKDPKILYISEAAKKYKKSGIGGEVGFGMRPVVMVVDVQRGFTSPECPLGQNMDATVNQIQKVLKEGRKKNVPIIYTKVAYRKDGLDAGVFGKKIPTLLEWFRLGSSWEKIDSRLEPKSKDLVILKKMPSAFFGTDLSRVLRSKKTDTLIVTGCTTSGCVRATVVDSLSHGYRTVVPEECVADRSEGPHKANLFDMATKYADVLPVQKVIDYLSGLDLKKRKR